VVALLDTGHLPRYAAGRDDLLVQMTNKSIEILDSRTNGFFLMIEGSQIDWGGHANSTKYIVNEFLDFDQAVGAALKFAKEDGNTLVVVTADHETGGMGLNGYDAEKNKLNAKYTTKSHTGIMVPVFAYGPGADHFSGVYDNTEIFHKMVKLLNLK
jgi:alkaline phosphatase